MSFVLTARKSFESWHVPDIGDNRDGDQQFQVQLKPMSARDAKNLEIAMSGGLLTGGKRKDNFAARAHDMNKKIICSYVTKVKGLTIKEEKKNDDGSTRLEIVAEPTNGTELWLCVEKYFDAEMSRQIVNDITDALQDHSKIHPPLVP